MTVFFNGSKTRTANFNAGDAGVAPKTLGHHVENTGTIDLIFLEMFKADRFVDLLRRLPKDKTPILPA
jgi:oxalate decarboxylase